MYVWAPPHHSSRPGTGAEAVGPAVPLPTRVEQPVDGRRQLLGGRPIPHLTTVPLADHEPGGGESLEVLDHRLAAGGEVGDELRRGLGPVVDEQLEDAPAGRIGERAEQLVERTRHAARASTRPEARSAARSSHRPVVARVSVIRTTVRPAAGSTTSSTLVVSAGRPAGHQDQVTRAPGTTSSTWTRRRSPPSTTVPSAPGSTTMSASSTSHSTHPAPSATSDQTSSGVNGTSMSRWTVAGALTPRS